LRDVEIETRGVERYIRIPLAHFLPHFFCGVGK